MPALTSQAPDHSAVSPEPPPERPESPRANPASEGHVPMRVKLAYGAPSFAGAALVIPIGIHLTIFYTDTVLVPLGLVALVKAVARAFDAVTDPLVGWLSDRTRTRWGRRKPWMALGSPLAAVALIAMWAPPGSLNGMQAAAWLATTYVLYYLFHTAYVIPHFGLGPELTDDYHERSRIFIVREAFVIAGTLCAAALPPILIAWADGDERLGYVAFATLFGVLLVLLYANLVLQVKERTDYVQRPPNPLVPGVRRVFRNRAFRVVMAVYLVASITGAIPGLMTPYFVKYVLVPENPNTWIGIFLGAYFAAGFATLPLWMWSSVRFGKKATWLSGFVPMMTGPLALLLMGAGDMIPAALCIAWAGVGFAPSIFLVQSIQADVIDYDELHTGRRREAQYISIWSLLSKFAVIPSMSVPLAVLASVGYAPNVEQSETVQWTIRAIYGLGPAITAALAMVVASFYPISQAVHTAIRQGIDAHARGESAVDPLTGARLAPPGDRDVDEETGWFLDHFSPRELERVEQRGPESLRAPIAFKVVLGGVVAFLATAFVVADVRSLETEPGTLAVMAILIAGYGLAAAAFHAVRWHKAGQLLEQPLPKDVVRRHRLAVEEGWGGVESVRG
ncbi:MAG: MFS transporter [Proteobacteria bacterium]|nr:MFS transporter [Pseudomonadota bacterium]